MTITRDEQELARLRETNPTAYEIHVGLRVVAEGLKAIADAIRYHADKNK